MIERIKNSIWFSVFINAGFLIFYLLLYYPVWDTNDDVGMQTFLVGAKGIRDAHAVYLHIWLGKLFCALYSFNQNIPWYPLAQYALIFCSLTAISWVLIRTLKQTTYLWIVILLISVCAYEGYIDIQFTKTAGLACAGGLILLFYALSQKKLPLCPYLTGLCLCTLSAMYRFNQFQCEIAMFGALAVYFFICILQGKKEDRFKKLSFCFITAALVLVLGYGSRFVHKQAYTSEEWQAYSRYNFARATLIDYGMPDFDKNKEAFEALGVDRPAYLLFSKWTHMDSEKFTTEVMEQMMEIQNRNVTVDKDFCIRFIRRVPRGFLKILTFWIYAVVLVCWLIRGRHGFKEILTVLIQVITVFVMYFYFFYLGRYLLNRVDAGIWIALTIGLLWLMNNEKPFLNHKINICLFAALFLLTQYNCRGMLRVNQAEKIDKEARRRKVVEAIHDDPDHLYLTKANTISLAKAYGVWDNIPYGIFANQFTLGGWAAPTPLYMTILDHYHVNNPFRDMIDNDSIYLIDNEIDVTVEYFRSWYDETITAEQVDKLGPYYVWKIVTNH